MKSHQRPVLHSGKLEILCKHLEPQEDPYVLKLEHLRCARVVLDSNTPFYWFDVVIYRFYFPVLSPAHLHLKTLNLNIFQHA